MPRQQRQVYPGVPHHITHRGNRRMQLFFSDADYLTYMTLIGKYITKYSVLLLAYCIMPNHIHLIAIPQSEDAFSNFMRDLQTTYASRFNLRTHSSGSVWGGRFYSSALDDEHLWAAIRYVECNPVRAGLVESAEMYRWSSAPAHCGYVKNTLLSALPEDHIVPTAWSHWLTKEDESFSNVIRQNTLVGAPCFKKRMDE